MEIILERTRIIFSDYTDIEKKKIEDNVATMDRIYLYEDKDNQKLYLPSGLITMIKKLFPKVQVKDHSSQYWEYAHIAPVKHSAQPRNQLQIDFIKFVIEQANKKQKLAGVLSPGTGKEEPISRKIPTPTPNGYTRMGDLKVGDYVFGRNGKPIKILAIFPQGVKDVYKITFSDGRTAQCGKEHLWNVTHAWCSKMRTVTLENILDDYKMYIPSIEKNNQETGANRDPYLYKYRIPTMSGPVQYPYQDVPIDPYVLGAFIGNGCLTDPGLTISSGNEFVPNKIADICGFNIKKSKTNYNYSFYNKKVGGRIKTREFFKNIPDLIKSYSRDKFIPDEYLYNDISIRMELLRGLMDTDGSISYAEGRYHVRYSSSSHKLLKQIQQLVRSLGYDAVIMIDNKEDKYVNRFHGNLLIKIPNKIKREFFSLPSKLYQLQKTYHIKDRYDGDRFDRLIIKDIQLIKREESRCIMVDAEDHLYLTQDFIVTHNTFMACYSAIQVGLRTLIIAPTRNIKDQWVDTLINMFKVPSEKVLSVNSPKDFVNVQADFVVTTQASLGVLNKSYDLEKIMKDNKFGIKVIDEVQMWFGNIIKVDGCSNICHNWYLTGTFGRSSEEENNLYQQMFGDLAVFREKDKKATVFNRNPGNVYGMKPHMHVKMIWTSSGLSGEEIKKVTSSMRYSEREKRWVRYGISIPAYTNLIIPSDGTKTKFLGKILEVIKQANKEVPYGKMLVLSATISSVEVLAKYIKKMYPDLKVGTIHSRNKKEDNDKVKAECNIMISTVKSSGTGFDVKDLSKLVVTESFKSWILTDQVSGRLRRRPDGKDTYMWDVVDSDIRQLRAWANARSDVLKRKAKSFKIVDL